MTVEASIIARLKQSRGMLITVESCTGGLLAHRLTQVAGASEVFWGGLVTYDNSAKEQLARVPREVLERHGAVSREAARALAEGGLTVLSQARPQGHGACLVTTGIAGPGGGTPQKPVGLCFVGLARAGAQTIVEEVRAPAGGARERNKNEFADAALALLLRQLTGESS